jgi:hypothetical protein
MFRHPGPEGLIVRVKPFCSHKVSRGLLGREGRASVLQRFHGQARWGMFDVLLLIVTISVHLCDLWFPFSCRRSIDGARVGKGSLQPQITQDARRWFEGGRGGPGKFA